MRIERMWVVLVLAGCASDERVVDRGACERLREHVISVRLDGIVDDFDAHRAAARQVLGDDFVTRCAVDTSLAELDCSLAAKTLESLHACRTAR